jgi:hypothetical protein
VHHGGLEEYRRWIPVNMGLGSAKLCMDKANFMFKYFQNYMESMVPCPVSRAFFL